MIDIKTIGSIALRAVRANKLRSTLTSLGIIIGVAAVIVMLAVGNGAQISIQQDMQAMGSNLIIVRSGVATSSGARGGHGSQPTMRLSDGNAIQEKLTQLSMRRDYGGNGADCLWQHQLVNRHYRHRQPEFSD